MFRTSAAFVFAFVVLPAASGVAQTAGTGATTTTPTSATSGSGNIGLQLTKVNDHDYPDPMNLQQELGIADCKGDGANGDGTITVTLTNVPNAATYKFIEVWLATGDKQCNASDRSTRVPTEKNCTKLVRPEGDQNTCTGLCQNIKVKLGPMCTDYEGPQQLYFLALKSNNSSEQADVWVSINNLNIDKTPPTPPSDVVGGSGETQIPLTWTRSGEQRILYWVVTDENASEGGTDDAGAEIQCSSSNLQAGAPFDPTGTVFPDGIATHNVGSSRGDTTFNGDEFTPHTLVAAWVVARDHAGNFSNLSNTACLNVVHTTGFWDRYKTNGGDAESGCACTSIGSARSDSHRGRAVLIELSALFAMAWLAARRRRRSHEART